MMEDVNAVTSIAYLVSSARQVTLQDGSSYPSGYLTLEDVLWPYERFVAFGADLTVITPDGLSPPSETYGLSCFFDCTDEDASYLASVVRTFAEHADDIRATLHHYVDLGLTAARRIDAFLRKRNMTPAEAYQTIAAAARVAWVQDRPLPRVLAQDPSVGVEFEQLQQIVDAQRLESEQRVEQRRAELLAIPEFRAPRDLSTLQEEDIEAFDALFVPSGYGALADLFDNADAAQLVTRLHQRRAPIATSGHGAAVLLSAPERSDGQWLFEGWRLTSITDEEEDQTPAGRLDMPWRLDVALKGAGAVFDDGPAAWVSHVVVDRNLISGQNPASTKCTVGALLEKLGARTRIASSRSQTDYSGGPSPPNNATPHEAVQKFVKALADRQLDVAMSLVASQVTVAVHPLGPDTAGSDLLRLVLADLLLGVPDLRLTAENVITTGDSVTALFRAHGTQGDDHARILPLNKLLDVDQAWRFVVTGGVITEVAVYWCQAQLMRRSAIRRYDEIAIA
jgi:putative intracellular protease/amidase